MFFFFFQVSYLNLTDLITLPKEYFQASWNIVF